MTNPAQSPTASTVDRDRLARLMSAEMERFSEAHPRSRALHERAKSSLLGGVPMNAVVVELPRSHRLLARPW